MLKIFLIILLILVCIVVLAYVFGPREPVHLDKVKSKFELGADLDAYLKNAESARDDIIPGLEKHIIWADADNKAKTPYSVIYVHGFSASLQETRPLADQVAAELGANLYFTRLGGHGLVQTETSTGMGEPWVHDWLNDTAEALAIGRALGDKVVVLSASTGGTLLTWALAQPEHNKGVAANIMVAPNYGVVNPAGRLFTMPWARQILPKVLGARRVWEPRDEEEAKYWTHNYSFEALVRMGTSVKLANKQVLEDMVTPTLFVYSELDDVVQPDLVKDAAKRWGKSNATHVEAEIVNDSEDENNHVIAGDCKSPNTTNRLTTLIVAFVKGLK